ncbi:ATP-binding protein [Streptomyces camelliae]|uniref:ATP-binding protein n=1 Tax=Streptomyces camelliae TaxID=3004093 RepID=A0ABY7PI06_9ACTN|nr:ATP-binding protein [Streptomyces sp. HUAS 2-6]WBO68013.1 ATP-binding protein [Streptomyces sp. HUAS 2-6]
MISHPSRHCTVELQALPSRIGQVRRIVSAQLRYWHMDPLIDRAALGVTELLSNVHRHARPDKSCTVELELRPDRLTVSVRDNDPRLPVPVDTADTPDAGPLATCGRGLAMVAAVSESWGARPDGENGKIVWFTLPAPAAARTHPAGPPRGTTQTARPAPEPARVSAAVPAAAGASVAAGAPVSAAVPLSAGTPVGATAPVGSATPGATPAPTVVHASIASGVQTPARPAVSG